MLFCSRAVKHEIPRVGMFYFTSAIQMKKEKKTSLTFKCRHTLVQFYTLIVKRIRFPSTNFGWFPLSCCSKDETGACTAEQTTGCQLFSIKDFQDTTADERQVEPPRRPCPPGKHLLEKRSSGRRYRSITSMITRHLDTPHPCELISLLHL